MKRLVTKSGSRLTISDKPGEETIALATPRSSRLLLTERSDETGRPAIALYTTGDILMDATNRIHLNAAQITRHVDGKIMHSMAVSFTDQYDDTQSYENTHIQVGLPDGSAFQGPVQQGQFFHDQPAGEGDLKSNGFYPPRPTPSTEQDA